jgi:hypothetical protein
MTLAQNIERSKELTKNLRKDSTQKAALPLTGKSRVVY